MSGRGAFLYYLATLWAVVFVAVALVTPPDPYTQLLAAGPLYLLAVPVAWWLTFQDGSARVRELVRERR